MYILVNLVNFKLHQNLKSNQKYTGFLIESPENQALGPCSQALGQNNATELVQDNTAAITIYSTAASIVGTTDTGHLPLPQASLPWLPPGAASTDLKLPPQISQKSPE